ncbi:TetR/AcrR family transcriptional regulator [uncultured Stenotrophomonas sp.]|uniref:TetR/AcrR family transcriptional regulator n=1 Tax=uncultured Stenotrophomonas sp. TaxID=165438 RepID=UPI0025CEFB42|nr:helix-turn-helix domain-containing protein [uncultured Stenotrophomonas sp.]
MAIRTPAAERICSAAVIHFAQRGYDGSSLTEIAEAVGIRKASLYAHFASKDALFLQAYGDALQGELAFVQACFNAEVARALPGSHYCGGLASRYSESPHLRFLLRTSYVPPQSLEKEIEQGFLSYLASLSELFGVRLEAWPETANRLSCADIKLYVEAYRSIVDCLHVKLVYTSGKNISERLKIMQRLLHESLRVAVIKGEQE